VLVLVLTLGWVVVVVVVVGSVVVCSVVVAAVVVIGAVTDVVVRVIGVSVANPHVNHVEGGGRYRQDHVQLEAKRKYDPKGLMNPGKMASF